MTTPITVVKCATRVAAIYFNDSLADAMANMATKAIIKSVPETRVAAFDRIVLLIKRAIDIKEIAKVNEAIPATEKAAIHAGH